MLQLFSRVLFQFLRDAHVLRAFQHLRIDDVGDDRLVLPRKVFVQLVDQLRPRHLRCVGHVVAPVFSVANANREPARLDAKFSGSLFAKPSVMTRSSAPRLHAAFAASVALLATVASAQTRVTAPDNKYTPAQDVEMGRKAA